MTRAAKSYDAVAEVRRVRDRLAKELQNMSPDEQVIFSRNGLSKTGVNALRGYLLH